MNRDEYEAILKRGIRLGLEAAGTHLTEGGWIPEIRELDPDTIAREAQDMGSDTSADTTA